MGLGKNAEAQRRGEKFDGFIWLTVQINCQTLIIYEQKNGNYQKTITILVNLTLFIETDYQ